MPPGPDAEEPGETTASETEAPVQADPDELYAALMDAIDSHHEGHFYEAVAAMGALPPDQMPPLLLKMMEDTPDDDWQSWHSDLGEAVLYSFVLAGPDALAALARTIDEIAAGRVSTSLDLDDVSWNAAWIAISYQTPAELTRAGSIVRGCAPIARQFSSGDGDFVWEDLSASSPYLSALDAADVEPGFEDVEEFYGHPQLFADLQRLWDEVTNPIREYAQWYAPEGRVIEVPWAQNRYNTDNWVISASSSAEGHPVEAIIDGDVSTFWAPAEDDSEPWVTFKAPERLTFWYSVGSCGLIVMIPGAGSDLNAFTANGRPTRLRMEYGDGTYRDHDIPYGARGDKRTRLFEPRVRWEHVADEFTIRLLDWEPGEQRRAPAISEVGTEPQPMGECGDGMSPILLY